MPLAAPVMTIDFPSRRATALIPLILAQTRPGTALRGNRARRWVAGFAGDRRRRYGYFYLTGRVFYHTLGDPLAQQLNIKSEDGYRLATELSALTGESLTTAVTEALRERLEREQRARDRAAKLTRLTALAAEIRASLRGTAGRLYGAEGLPE